MCVCVCVLCEMVVKIVEMHLPLGCFVDFLWLRPGRNAPHAALSSMIEIATATETETAIATAVYALCEVQQCCLRSLKYLEACSNATDISHLYFVWFFSPSLFPSLSLSNTIYIWLSCLWLLWFYILHIQTVWRHSVSSTSLFRALSYAFTWNSCGWQLVQNYSSAKVSSSRFFPLFFPLFSAFSFFTFHFKVQKNLPKDKLSSAKVRAEF